MKVAFYCDNNQPVVAYEVKNRRQRRDGLQIFFINLFISYFVHLYNIIQYVRSILLYCIQQYSNIYIVNTACA